MKAAVAISLGIVLSFFISNTKAQGTLNLFGSPDSTETSSSVTMISFEETVHDFGDVKKGDTLQFKFKFKNIGEEPLEIVTVKPSCSCSKLEWPKTAVPVGGGGEISVSYPTTEKSPGSNEVFLRVLYNGMPELETLTLTMKIVE